MVDPTGLRALPQVPQVICAAATRQDTGVDLPLGLPLTLFGVRGKRRWGGGRSQQPN